MAAAEAELAQHVQSSGTTQTEETKAPTENQHDADNDSYGKNIERLINKLYYVYYENKIMGPFDHTGIVTLVIAKKIEGLCWVKSIKDNQYCDDVDWCKVVLSKSDASKQDEKLKQNYPDLHEYLMRSLSCKQMNHYDPPIDAPTDALSNLSIGTKVTQTLGRIIAAIAFLLIGAHVLPTFCVAVLFWGLPGYFLCADHSANNEPANNENVAADNMYTRTARLLDTASNRMRHNYYLTGGFSFITYLGLPITPFLIVHVLLLDVVDYPEWNGEIQSWMVAYLTWGVCAYLFTVGMAIRIAAAKKNDNRPRPVVRLLMNTMFFIIGVEFGDVDPMRLFNGYWSFYLGVTFWCPALAALLPAATAGFIANFVLEEKFELVCSADVENKALCYAEQGCCEVISSHDGNNSYAFFGGLSSNILAMWAAIRIAGYLLVNFIPEMAVFAKRSD